MLLSSISAVGILCFMFLLATTGNTGDGYEGMSESELAAALVRLERTATNADSLPEELLELARQARRVQERADALSPDAISILSETAHSNAMQFATLAMRNIARSDPGARARVRSDTYTEKLDGAWTFMINQLLYMCERWPQYWNAPISETPVEEVWLPSILLGWCRTDQLGGDDWEMQRIANPRIATLPESIATYCLGPRACNHVWRRDCRMGLLAEMAKSPERDALVGYRFAAEFWSETGSRGAFSVYDRTLAADATVIFFEHMLSMARGGDDYGLPGEAIPESVVLDRMRTVGSLWPPDGNPFRTIPGFRNPRVGTDRMITCDLLVDPTCAASATQVLKDNYKYLTGGDVIVR